MSHIIYAFDVFDTCLVRNLARPADLFFVLAERMLAQHLSRPYSYEEVSELARLRIEAERTARHASAKEDITLDCFYQRIQDLAQWGISAETMMQAEIQLEIESVRPILQIKQKIDHLRQQEQCIIFISDMYLPRPVIRQMLVEHGFAHDADHIYVSGEIGLTKYSGSLFEYVLTAENINPWQLWHHGDNPYSDVLIPRRLGINTVFFPHSQLNRYETKIVAQRNDWPWQYSQLAGISRVTRLSGKINATYPALNSIAADVIAPLLTNFVTWVLKDAQKREIKRLYFVSRDGQILCKIAQNLAKVMPAPQCRYLYGSRQAWFLPSLSRCDRNSLDWLVVSGHSTIPVHLLKKLTVEPDEITGALKSLNLDDEWLHSPLDAQNPEKFWQFVEHPDVNALILKKAACARQMTAKYLAQEGLDDSSPWALVDIGWTLKTQRAVREILAFSLGKQDVEGYYFAVLKDRQPVSAAGRYRAFLLEEPKELGYNARVGSLLNNIQLIEQVVTAANHGAVTGYTMNGDTIVPCLKNAPGAQKLQFVAELHQHILRYVDEWVKSSLSQANLTEFKWAIIEVATEFVSNPHKQEVESIGWNLIGDDQNEARQHRLARKLTLKDLIYYAGRLFRLIDPRDFTQGFSWFEGSLVISNLWMRAIFSSIVWVHRFKRNGGYRRLLNWWSRVRAKENL